MKRGVLTTVFLRDFGFNKKVGAAPLGGPQNAGKAEASS
jgi:hypothetical protein